MVPLPQLKPLSETPWPFGINLTRALPPAGTSNGSKVSTFQFVYYAGKLWLNRTSFDNAVKGNAFIVDGQSQQAQPIAACLEAKLVPVEQGQIDGIPIYGARYRVTGDVNKLGACIAAAEQQLLVNHPYAAGALNIKAMGDIFGHTTHGLIGALVIEPQGATYEGRAAGATTLTLSPAHVKPQMAVTVPAISLSDRTIPSRVIKEHVLFFQDGLNLRDKNSRTVWKSGSDRPRIVDDCPVCDDSYDFGEKGVSGTSAPFYVRLRSTAGLSNMEAQSDLNEVEFPKTFFSPAQNPVPVPVTVVDEGDEVVMRVLHPGGRARQRAFVTVGNDYDDVFPGFGFPHSALLAPGKGVTAALSRPVIAGCYMWHDGPSTLWSGGTWGFIDVRTKPYQTSKWRNRPVESSRAIAALCALLICAAPLRRRVSLLVPK